MRSHISSFLSLPTALLLLGVVSCGSEDPTASTAPSTAAIEVADFTALSARNVLIRWKPKRNGTMRIQRAREDGEMVWVADKPADRGRFLDLALEPLTTYSYLISHCSGDICGPAESLGSLTTPPSRIQPVEVEIPANGTDDDLVVFGVSVLDTDVLDLARMVAVDRQGNVVWEYVREESYLAPVTEVHLLDDGTFATGHNCWFIQLDLDGTELFRYEGNTAHHDIDPTSSGFIFLNFDVFADTPGEPVLGGQHRDHREGGTVSFVVVART